MSDTDPRLLSDERLKEIAYDVSVSSMQQGTQDEFDELFAHIDAQRARIAELEAEVQRLTGIEPKGTCDER